MSEMHSILEAAAFPDDAKAFFKASYERLQSDPAWFQLLCEAEEAYFDGKIPDDTLDRLAAATGLHRYSVDMLLLLHAAIRLRTIYAQKDLSDALFADTLADLRVKLAECRRVYGLFGTFVLSWFYRFYEVTRFKLGRLEYETIQTDFDAAPYIKKGDTILNVHIPSGESLSPQAVEQSLQMAYDFYGFDGVMPVVCQSWLLYPPLYEVFPEGSNLRAFYERFHIADHHESPLTQDAWRVFGTMDTTLANLPRETALQKRLLAFLQDGHTMGCGRGILLYTPPHIVTKG